MAYLKPQSPITNGEDHLYPLTTYDQIIMPDESRWNGSSDVTSVCGKTGAVSLSASDVGIVYTTDPELEPPKVKGMIWLLKK